MRLTNITVPGVVLLLSSCAPGEWEAAPRPTAVRSERDVYIASVASHPALGDWEDASSRALRSGLRVAASFRERIAFPGSSHHAIAYRLTMVRGQALSIAVTPVQGDGNAFADVFHDMGGDVFRPVHWADEDGGRRRLVARSGGEYVVRIQPPIGESGMFDVTITGDASLVFPVAGGDPADIGSVFGDPRDNGTRAHEGVDIFAPRGTRVIAVADGYITQARNTPTGGLVIWQQDASADLQYYYAHLDDLHVSEGARVKAGDVIGRVGNTGNARAARPHLHFSIYRPGTIALDPAPLLTRSVALRDQVYGHDAGRTIRVSGDRVRLRRSPSLAGSIITELSADTRLLVLGDSGEWQRVVLEDGTTGFVAARLTGREW